MHITIEKNLQVAMRDGVQLATDVYRPADGAKVPVLLQRHPYNKEHAAFRDQAIDVLRVVQQGYAVVTQDSRGTFASPGELRLLADEAADGADAIAWAAAQPWSSGQVGMVGASYYGATQWLAAGQAPPALKAFAPLVSSPDYHGGWAYRGGAFELGFNLLWNMLVLGSGELLKRIGEGRATVEDLLRQLGYGDGVDQLYERLPLSQMPELGDLTPHYFDWLAHPSYDEYWRANAPATDFGAIAAPTLSMGGWFDIFLRGTLQGYQEMKRAGASARARRPRLVIGPWAHGQLFGAFPERQFGVLGSAEGADITGMQLSFFDRHLKGVTDGYDDQPPVKIFVMGPNVWREEQDWPLPDTRFTDWFLHSDGRANTAGGDGSLSLQAPAQEQEDIFLYDPRNPVPTCGGESFLPALFIGANSGPRDQAQIERRQDVLCFTSAPLERDLEVTGPVELVLHCASSAPDTDFTGKLVDVHPDGRAEIVTDGILRLRYRDSLSEPSLLQPGRGYEVRIDMSATSTVFAAGHRLRLEVSSSNFPRFDRNTNTGGTIAQEGPDALQVAVNRVFHDGARPSRLVLPIIERG